MNTLPKIEDIARRGLKCSQKIDHLLDDIWRDLKTLEPEIADVLENTFGSTELATLMIIGRVNNQPSFLEELAEKNISKDNFENHLQQRLDISAQITEHRLETKSDEISDSQFIIQEKLSQLANQAHKDYEDELLRVFKKLKEDDIEVASMSLELFGDVVKSAKFMAIPAKGLGNKSPLQVLEEGRRQEVLDLIGRLEHGIPY